MPLATINTASFAIPRLCNRSLSSFAAITGPDHFNPVPFLSFAPAGDIFSPATIRMGGGSRTYPGGVSKWQWKRMQLKKSKHLLKARLCRERQLYEMRKRAELKAAISELERPWELVERAPVLFSTSANDQVKALADRFQRPGGFDMWSEMDGPRIFRSPDDLPSARFYPKGPVHSVRPYGVITGDIGPDGLVEGEKEMRYDDWIARGAGGMGRGKRARRSSFGFKSPEKPEKSGEWIGRKNGGSQASDSETALSGSRDEGGGDGDDGHCRDDNRFESGERSARRGSKWKQGSGFRA